MYLWHSAQGFYGETDLYPVMMVGAGFAVALHNCRSFRQTASELETDELTGRVEVALVQPVPVAPSDPV
ncbi:MAG: hypothetical protein ACLFR8_07735 [Alkalispirochaeta sp.]